MKYSKRKHICYIDENFQQETKREIYKTITMRNQGLKTLLCM